MGLIDYIAITTKHQCRKAATDASSLLVSSDFVDYSDATPLPVNQLYVGNNQDTPPLSGVCLLSKGETFYEFPQTTYRRTGKSTAVHAK